jgi:H+/Cl- antiporter ClcA
VSNLGGIPLFPLGMVSTQVPEWQQLAWALLVGSLTGLLGGLFARTLLGLRGWLGPRLAGQPLLWGLALGTVLALMALLSDGWSGGDGEVLLKQLLEQRGPLPAAACCSCSGPRQRSAWRWEWPGPWRVPPSCP